MAKIEVHAGDFLAQPGHLVSGVMILLTKEHNWVGEKIPLSELETVEAASEESVKKLMGTVGWGAAGALLLGPLGLLAGALLGGKRKEVTFVAKFKDGRKLLATTDNKAFIQLQAAVFNGSTATAA